MKEEQQTKIKWEDTKDELYTYFGKCELCQNTCVIVGSAYCHGCGRRIKNTLRETNI